MKEFNGVVLPQDNRREWVAVVWKVGYDGPSHKRVLSRSTTLEDALRRLRRWLHRAEVVQGPQRERHLRKAGL